MNRNVITLGIFLTTAAATSLLAADTFDACSTAGPGGANPAAVITSGMESFKSDSGAGDAAWPSPISDESEPATEFRTDQLMDGWFDPEAATPTPGSVPSSNQTGKP